MDSQNQPKAAEKQQEEVKKNEEDKTFMNNLIKDFDKKENISATVQQRQESCLVKDVNKEDLPSDLNPTQVQQHPTLLTALQQDKEDASLEKYKQQLLQGVDLAQLQEGKPLEVEFTKLEIVCDNRPGGNIIIDLRKESIEKIKFRIKEGTIYQMKVYFIVRYDCVLGLKFVNNVYRKFIKVDQFTENLGTFAPKKEEQCASITQQQAPSGFIGRGVYKGKALFIDGEGRVHMQFQYEFKSAKDWISKKDMEKQNKK